MTESFFTKLHRDRWRAFSEILARKSSKRFPEKSRAEDFPRAYRLICRDLNLARARRYSWTLIEDLNRLVWEGHQVLYRRRAEGLWAWIDVLASQFPATFRRFWAVIVVCHVLFYGVALGAFFYAQASESHAEFLMGPDGLAQMRSMYNPKADHFLHPRGVGGDADMFGFYINNNITIGLRTFAAGALAGVGSLALLVFNAVALGAAAGAVTAAGFAETFFPFVSGHGAFELTAILMFAAAGFHLGISLIRPGVVTRSESLRRAAYEMVPLVAGSVVFLFLAACLEAFWSSRPGEISTKLTVAGFLWVTVYGFLLFGGRRERG